MHSHTVNTALLLAAILLAPDQARAADGPLSLESKIPLGAVRGRIDHLAVDLARQRLFVAELGNGSLGVVDLAQGKVVHRIEGLKEPQGVGYAPESDTVYVASAGDGTLKRYAGADLSLLGVTELGDDADNVRLDPRTGEVVVGYGGGAIALIDGATGAKESGMALSAHPESFRLETGGHRVFVNVPDAHEVAVLDRDAGRQVASWPVKGRGNFPMALDEAGGRLLIVDRDPPELLAFDTGSGEPVARLPACGDADDVFFDAKRKRVYVSCGEGFVGVVPRHGDAFGDPVRIATAAGARTALFVPEFDRLFVAVRGSGGEKAAIWVFRPES
ncbi:MAG: YncE family protein [Geminicoccaceae bacterium]